MVTLGSWNMTDVHPEKLRCFESAMGVLVLTGTDRIGPADVLALAAPGCEAVSSDFVFLLEYLPGVEAVKKRGLAQNLGPVLFGLGVLEEESERFLLFLGDFFFKTLFAGDFKCFLGETVIQNTNCPTDLASVHQNKNNALVPKSAVDFAQRAPPSKNNKKRGGQTRFGLKSSLGASDSQK